MGGPRGDPSAVTSLGDLLPVELRRTVLVAAAALADEQGRAAALDAVAPVLTAQEVLAVAPAARAITDPMLRAMVLTAWPACRHRWPLRPSLPCWNTTTTGRLLSVLPALAERLNRPQLDDLLDYLAAADSALTRMWTIGTLAPHLDARQHQRALTAIGFPEPLELWLYGAAGFLPRLPEELRGQMQDFCTRLMSERGLRGGVGDLLPHLRPEQMIGWCT